MDGKESQGEGPRVYNRCKDPMTQGSKADRLNLNEEDDINQIMAGKTSSGQSTNAWCTMTKTWPASG